MNLLDLQGKILDEFWHSGNCSGGIVRDCKHGITFFEDSPRAGDWDEGELENLIEQAKKDPEHYVALGQSAHFTYLFGMEWCWDCEKCLEEALKYQTFIWGYRYSIASFLNQRLANVATEAVGEKEQLSVVLPELDELPPKRKKRHLSLK